MIFCQHLSPMRRTLHYFGPTLSLRPRAAATRNIMRMAENAFIFLIGIKNSPEQALYDKFIRFSLWDWLRPNESWSFIIFSYLSGGAPASKDTEIITLLSQH